nr:MAG TPA: hypothetical protein [Caudoviricetes sp.]
MLDTAATITMILINCFCYFFIKGTVGIWNNF